MITEEDIIEAARLVRKRYEDCVNSFPYGFCVDASYDLHNELAKLGVASNVINGVWKGPLPNIKKPPDWGLLHSWVSVPSFDMLIDITADQFDNRIPSVYIEYTPYGRGGKYHQEEGIQSQITPEEARRFRGVGIPGFKEHLWTSHRVREYLRRK